MQDDDIHAATESFETVAKLKYFGRTRNDENCLREEIKKKWRVWGGRIMCATTG
jgi:hypothetical protein